MTDSSATKSPNNKTHSAVSDTFKPLAELMRPQSPAEFYGQQHLLGDGKPLAEIIRSGQPHSMILWGPPGTGKTTLARMLANLVDAEFIAVSAVLSGVADIREAIKLAEQNRNMFQRKTILFIDEVHRFNKSQQDAFLPFVEDGTVIFIGATTENPSFEVNNALLSRTRVYPLNRLDESSLEQVLQRALQHYTDTQGIPITIEDEAATLFIQAADGDARRLLNLLDIAATLATPDQDEKQSVINKQQAVDALSGSTRSFDNKGDIFYEQISALHKAVRGSSPDAALYWLARMLDGGCDPLYIARRVVRMASEDIGNADPRALSIALDAWETVERLGQPEGDLALAQAISYLACAAKSNAVYMAFKAAMHDARQSGSLPVPMHLRNAATAMMKDMGYGDRYRYAHDEPEGYAAGESYLPQELAGKIYYEPVDRGLEKSIREKLDYLKKLDQGHAKKQ